ncbi:hypothetical protein D3C77_557670 [compost metagenome]
MSSASNLGYTASRSPSEITRSKPTDSSLSSTSSTSVCGIPSASIMCLTVAPRAHAQVKDCRRRSAGRKSLSSS